MKALVLWCRWHEARLRLSGRDTDSVWGELAFSNESQPFHFHLPSRRLTIGQGENSTQHNLDEMGVEQTAQP